MKKIITIAICLLAVSSFAQVPDSTTVPKADLDKVNQRLTAVEREFIINYLQTNQKTAETAFMDFYLEAKQLKAEQQAFQATVGNFIKELSESKSYKQDTEIMKKYQVKRKADEK